MTSGPSVRGIGKGRLGNQDKEEEEEISERERRVFFSFRVITPHHSLEFCFFFFSLSRSPLIFIRWGAETPVAGKRAKSAGTRGDPPQDNILREEKSSDWHQGLLTISVNL